MAFDQEANTTKDSIEDFTIEFFVPGPGNISGIQDGQLSFQIELSNGTIETKSGVDLLARLNDDAAGLVHLAALGALRDYLRTRLNAEVLP